MSSIIGINKNKKMQKQNWYDLDMSELYTWSGMSNIFLTCTCFFLM